MGKPAPLEQLSNRTAGRRMERFLMQGRFQAALDLVDECAALAPGERGQFPQVMADYMVINQLPAEHLGGMEEHGPTLMRKLHALGVSPNQMSFAGTVPLLIHAVLVDNLPLVRTLLELGADPNKISLQDEHTPLMELTRDNAEMAQVLIEHGANIHAKTQWDDPTLWLMAERGFVRVMRVLVDHGAHIHHLDGTGGTLLHHLANSRKLEDVAQLYGPIKQAVLWGVDPDTRNHEEYTALDMACAAGRHDVFARAIADAVAQLQAREMEERTCLAGGRHARRF